MAPKTIAELCANHLVSVGIFINKYDTHCGYVRLRPRGGGGEGVVPMMAYCWFSHDVTKIQTTKLSILLRFYFHDDVY